MRMKLGTAGLHRKAIVAGLGIALMGSVALAEGEGGDGAASEANILADATKTAVEGVSPIAATALAHRLFEWGTLNSDALSMYNASRILGEAEAAVEAAQQGEPVELEDEGEPVADKDGASPVIDAAAMLAAAREAAGDSPALAALIEESEGTQSRRFVRGDQLNWHRTRVRAFSDDNFRWRTARGGELAEVAIVGDGDTDLDLFVYDENWNVICAETGFSDREYCRWTPRWTGQFRIVVRNHGAVYNEYHILIY